MRHVGHVPEVNLSGWQMDIHPQILNFNELLIEYYLLLNKNKRNQKKILDRI